MSLSVAVPRVPASHTTCSLMFHGRVLFACLPVGLSGHMIAPPSEWASAPVVTDVTRQTASLGLLGLSHLCFRPSRLTRERGGGQSSLALCACARAWEAVWSCWSGDQLTGCDPTARAVCLSAANKDSLVSVLSNLTT